MGNQIQINDENEIAAQAELEAVKMISARIAEQNTAVLSAIKAMTEEIIAQAEHQTAAFASLVDAIKAVQISVKVPEQPAPVVNVEQPPASKRKTKATIRKNKDGDIVGFDLVEE